MPMTLERAREEIGKLEQDLEERVQRFEAKTGIRVTVKIGPADADHAPGEYQAAVKVREL